MYDFMSQLKYLNIHIYVDIFHTWLNDFENSGVFDDILIIVHVFIASVTVGKHGLSPESTY